MGESTASASNVAPSLTLPASLQQTFSLSLLTVMAYLISGKIASRRHFHRLYHPFLHRLLYLHSRPSYRHHLPRPNQDHPALFQIETILEKSS